MADYKKPDGTYLPEGIYMEATALSLTGGRGGAFHSYLIYRDGKGEAEVIRGGMDIGRLNNDLVVEINKDLSSSKDAYQDKNINYFDQKTHLYAKLDIGGKNAQEVWSNMKNTAAKIDPTIDYRLKSGDWFKTVRDVAEDNQTKLDSGTAVCHSVVGTVLKDSGLSIDDAVQKMSEVNQGTKRITKDSFTGIETDLLHDDVKRGVYDENMPGIRKFFNKLNENTNEIKAMRKSFENIEKSLNEIMQNMPNKPTASTVSSESDASLQDLVVGEIGEKALDDPNFKLSYDKLGSPSKNTNNDDNTYNT